MLAYSQAACGKVCSKLCSAVGFRRALTGKVPLTIMVAAVGEISEIFMSTELDTNPTKKSNQDKSKLKPVDIF